MCSDFQTNLGQFFKPDGIFWPNFYTIIELGSHLQITLLSDFNQGSIQ